jgi:outer membrane protein assembly factor BamB
MTESKKSRLRWPAFGLIATLVLLGVFLIWRRDISQQDRILKTGILIILSALAFYFWALFLAGFRKRTRLWVFLGGLAVIGLFAGSVKITGVSGDLLPIFRFRWTKAREVAALPVSSATNSPAAATLTNAAASSSFPQFLGPDRNGIIPGVNLETNWTTQPPKELWRREVGPAWTGFAVARGLAITQEQRGPQEIVSAYSLETGAPIWSHADEAHYLNTLGGEGPRANPTIEGDRVYAFGAMGILNCLDLATGKLIWSVNIPREHSTSAPEWGYAGAPLVRDGLVMVNSSAGDKTRTLAAHDAATGKFVWGGGEDSAGYSSPAVLTLLGAPQAILFTQGNVAGFDLKSGATLWKHPWPGGHPHVSTPIQISSNQVFASSGYGYGSELIEISRATNNAWKAERVWKSNRLKSKFANLILRDGYVYGLDDGILACMDAATGERKWQGERYGHGQMLLIGNTLLLMAEKGDLLLIDPNPQEERIVARFKVLTGKTWNPPAFAAPYLLVRNDQEAACFRLATKP